MNLKDIKGYEGTYRISDCGKVFNSKTGRKIKPGFAGKYQIVGLSKAGIKKKYTIHSLIMQTFKDYIPEEGKVIDHIDSNPLNNNIDNLRVLTIRENVIRSQYFKNKKSGLPMGVYKYKGKFAARFCGSEKRIHLGTFSTPEEASIAYKNYTKK